jgi:hypothetical protein
MKPPRETLEHFGFGLLSLIVAGALLVCLALALFIREVAAHDWYSELKNAQGAICCGDKDCAPYPHRTTPGETGYELFIGGRWWPVAQDEVIGLFSPDGQAHACCYPGGCEEKARSNPLPGTLFRCVVLPGQGV